LFCTLTPGDTKIFEEGALGTTPGGGGGLTTYKELCSLATDIGQPDLVYKFMDLARHSAAVTSRRGAAAGVAGIARLVGEQGAAGKGEGGALAALLGQERLAALLPKLYRWVIKVKAAVPQLPGNSGHVTQSGEQLCHKVGGAGGWQVCHAQVQPNSNYPATPLTANLQLSWSKQTPPPCCAIRPVCSPASCAPCICLYPDKHTHTLPTSRSRYDPSPRVAEAMKGIWAAMVDDTRATRELTAGLS
jgi:hypothetical protein